MMVRHLSSKTLPEAPTTLRSFFFSWVTDSMITLCFRALLCMARLGPYLADADAALLTTLAILFRSISRHESYGKASAHVSECQAGGCAFKKPLRKSAPNGRSVYESTSSTEMARNTTRKGSANSRCRVFQEFESRHPLLEPDQGDLNWSSQQGRVGDAKERESRVAAQSHLSQLG